jgi:hypothetical protein
MPRGRILPFALGMYSRREGLNWKLSSRRVATMSSMTPMENPSRVVPSVPGVMFPGADLIFSYATT